MFADYRVPQTLRLVGIMDYSSELATLIDTTTLDKPNELAYSSLYEVEIRAATVLAVEKIMNEIKKRPAISDKIKYAFQVDWLLWQMGECQLDKLKPHHCVHSIFY